MPAVAFGLEENIVSNRDGGLMLPPAGAAGREIQHFSRTGWSGKAADILFPWRVSAGRTRLRASAMEAYRLLPYSREAPTQYPRLVTP